MTYDVKIVNGLLVDGSGGEPRRGDVGIRDGRIVAVGEVSGPAAREIDATGAIVTPGFIDIHTHYDGQASWDASFSPSCFHGVTTAVMGNCGVGFAPVRERDREALIALMEGVEDIPGAALAEGIAWNWESFPSYMKALDDAPHVIDFAAQVPHDALRVFVMGERALAGEDATEQDIAQMQALLREAILAGAVGFTTGRSDNHRSRTGAATPAAEASERELRGLAAALHGLPSGVIQAVSDFNMNDGDEPFDGEFDLIEAMGEASGKTVSVSLSQRDRSPNQWRKILERAERATARGVQMHVQVGARGIGVMLGLQATFHPFVGFPSYKKIAHLPLSERVAIMRDPVFKAQILSEKSEPLSGDGSAVPPLADQLLAAMDFVSMRMFRLGESPNYEQGLDDSLCAEAQRRGVPVLEAVYDALLESDGEELIYFPIFNYTEMSLDNVHTMLTHPLALSGLSDGGAHVGTVCDASFSTFLLTHWARDRKGARLPLQRVVQMLTADGADYLGLGDRGRIAVGKRADLNVIDFERLSLARPHIVHDLPAGGRRLIQEARGYLATLVKGEVVVESGKLTGKTPGKLARATRD